MARSLDKKSFEIFLQDSERNRKTSDIQRIDHAGDMDESYPRKSKKINRIV